MKKSNKVHFIGIGGSGVSGVALIAKAQGFEVSGCDMETQTPYIEKVKEQGITVYQGQDASHLVDIDIVATTPAIFFQNEESSEVYEAKKHNLMTWQKFLGQYLQKDKIVICIAGTHGKSTTTAMAAQVFEDVSLDPWAMIGAIIPSWNSNARIGKGDLFIAESDEFYDNFLNYSPDVIVLNNIEFDHPDFFENEQQMYESFKRFVLKLKGKKILIYNEDDPGIDKLFEMIGKKLLSELNLHGYTLQDKNIILKQDRTEFEVDKERYTLKIPGKYNVSNSLGVIALAKVFDVPADKIKKSLAHFSGIARRLELIGDKNGIKIYDDYAHHPTAIKQTLKALRQLYPENNITAIIEPHTFSRTKALLHLYKDAFVDADKVIMAPVFKSRDTQDFGVSSKDIIDVSNHKNINYLESFDLIVEDIVKTSKTGDVIIVMGAGKSYELTKQIVNNL